MVVRLADSANRTIGWGVRITPEAVSDDVDTIEDAMDGASDPSKVSSRKVDRAYADIGEWTAASC